MDDQRVGRIVRALRRRRGWRQVDVAAAAECSQNLVSRLERGHIDGLSLRLIRRILAALDALILIELQWQGAAIDRLLDEDHAALVGVIAKRLRELGWLVEVEVTYSHFGERGSIDILAFWPTSGVVLVIEVKTDLPSAEATLRKLDEKVRLAPVISLQRFKWNVSAVARLVVFPDVSTLRRRVARHTNIFGTALPERSIAFAVGSRHRRQPLCPGCGSCQPEMPRLLSSVEAGVIASGGPEIRLPATRSLRDGEEGVGGGYEPVHL